MVEIISRPKIKKWKVKCGCGAELKYAESDEHCDFYKKQKMTYYIDCPVCKCNCITRKYSTELSENYLTGRYEYPLDIDYRSEEFYE